MQLKLRPEDASLHAFLKFESADPVERCIHDRELLLHISDFVGVLARFEVHRAHLHLEMLMLPVCVAHVHAFAVKANVYFAEALEEIGNGIISVYCLNGVIYLVNAIDIALEVDGFENPSLILNLIDLKTWRPQTQLLLLEY